MQEITKKLHNQAINAFYPVAEQMAKEGATADQIVDMYQRHLRIKTAHYHQNDKGLQPLSLAIKGVFEKIKADSHTEQIFYDLLIKRDIQFQFQYPIGPYQADYLLGGFLVVEIDGPQHTKEHDEKRDKYMRKLGYRIIRVPVWVLVIDPEAVLDEIEDQLSKFKLVKK